MTDLELYRGRSLLRAASRYEADMRARQSVQRAEDLARTYLAAGRISDIARVTRHGIAAATVIAAEAEMAASLSPWAQNQIAFVAQVGIAGIANVVADLADPYAR